MHARLRSAFPALLLAAGILLATAVSVSIRNQPEWALAGPLVLGGAIVAARFLANRLSVLKTSYVPAMIIGAAMVTAGSMVAVADPKLVPLLMPVLGVSALPMLQARVCVA
jgi:hypothetical protein